MELQAFDLGNGVCKYLDLDSNMCKIYDDRPEICNIESMYKKHFYRFYTKEEFIRLNIESCNAMQERFGIEDRFRIKYLRL